MGSDKWYTRTCRLPIPRFTLCRVPLCPASWPTKAFRGSESKAKQSNTIQYHVHTCANWHLAPIGTSQPGRLSEALGKIQYGQSVTPAGYLSERVKSEVSCCMGSYASTIGTLGCEKRESGKRRVPSLRLACVFCGVCGCGVMHFVSAAMQNFLAIQVRPHAHQTVASVPLFAPERSAHIPSQSHAHFLRRFGTKSACELFFFAARRALSLFSVFGHSTQHRFLVSDAINQSRCEQCTVQHANMCTLQWRKMNLSLSHLAHTPHLLLASTRTWRGAKFEARAPRT